MADDVAGPAILPPRENPDLVGHETAERTLLTAFAAGRLPHAWLISGPEGMGKATLAYRFARFVLASRELLPVSPQSLAVPPTHPVFRRVASGGHADLLVVEPAWDEKRGRRREEIVVDDVRALNNFFALTPAEGGWRVAVIDTADDMNRHAANAVLKILEEPPPRGLILLISHAPGRLLATIRSRCRRLVLRSLPEGVMAALLGERFPELTATDRHALAGLAEGSVGRVFELAGKGGLELYAEVVGLLGTLPHLDVTALHRLADRAAQRGEKATYPTLSWLLGWWLARAIRCHAIGANIPDVIPGDAETARRLLSEAPLDRWIEVWEKTGTLMARADGANLDRKQVILNVFSALDRTAQGADAPVLTWS